MISGEAEDRTKKTPASDKDMGAIHVPGRQKRMNISAMILAGGRSERMGQDKALLSYDRESFLSHLIRELQGTSDPSASILPCEKTEDRACGNNTVITELFLSVAHEGDYAEMGLPLVVDENQGIGPIEGIRRGLSSAREEYLFVCAVDMPFVQRDMVFQLAQYIVPDYDAYVFREGEQIHPACAIYHRSVLACAEQMIREGRYRLRDLSGSVRTRYVEIADTHFRAESLRNINTPQEYRESLKTV